MKNNSAQDYESGKNLAAGLVVQKGHQFTLTVPESESQLDQADNQEFETQRVLYVEDNLSNARLMTAIFRAQKHLELCVATTAGQGWEMVNLIDPSLVLLDCNLPDKPGLELLLEFKRDERLRSIPVIVVSADATAGQQQRMLEAGALAYVTKPFNIVKFWTVLGQFVNLAPTTAPSQFQATA